MEARTPAPRALAAVKGLFARRRLEAELDEELRFHLAMEAAEQARRGASRLNGDRIVRGIQEHAAGRIDQRCDVEPRRQRTGGGGEWQ